jgi:hypothetical protein
VYLGASTSRDEGVGGIIAWAHGISIGESCLPCCQLETWVMELEVPTGIY